MITAKLKNDSLAELAKSVRAAGRKLPQETAAALNKVAGQTRTLMSRQVRTELAAPAKVVNKVLRKSRRATKAQLRAAVALDKTRRIPLRDFGSRQTKAGVSYKISKRGKRGLAKGAFQGPKPGVMKASWRGNVFRRVGKARLPIVKLKGPSPWGVFVKNSMAYPVVAEVGPLLKKELERRIRFNTLKASGAI